MKKAGNKAGLFDNAAWRQPMCRPPLTEKSAPVE